MKVYEAIAQALLAEHDGPIFGLMGDGNMSLWGALGREPRANLLSSRNEAGAVARRTAISAPPDVSASRPSLAVPA